MNRALLLLTVSLLTGLPGCAAPGEDTLPAAASASVTAPPAQDLWNFDTSADAIRAASCGDSTDPASGLAPLDFSAQPLNAKQTEVLSGRLPEGADLAGAWVLGATDPNFGGLSGISVVDDNTLLAISDSGGWVSLSLENGAPSGASLGYMRGADGKFLNGKFENDAEDVAYRDGIALVSFERDFRMEAFATGTCGAAAKAVRVAKLPVSHDGRAIDQNEGPEAMTLTPSGTLRFGYEGASDSLSPLGRVLANGAGEWSGGAAPNPAGFALVSMATVSLPSLSEPERTVYLYRAFDPLRGARSVLVWGDGATQKLTLSRPVMTDNFEGMAVQPTGPDTARIWLVSDDNFTKLQRTLLYAVDVTFD
jgi:hypothetical protein